jgi:hypothetical protein
MLLKAQQILAAHLEARDRAFQPRVGVYGSPQRLLLDHGLWYQPQPVPPGIWAGVPRMCFGNAIICAVAYDLPYIEGWALLSLNQEPAVALHHAWNLDPEGRVLDVTWHPYLGLAYLGMAFRPERADDATWHGDGTVLEDAKRHYPLLQHPWHGEPPDQRWPYSPRLDAIRRRRAQGYFAPVWKEEPHG